MKVTISPLPALAMGAAISTVIVSGGLGGVAAFAAGGVHLVTSIRVLSHAPGAVQYAVTVLPAGGPAHAATAVIGTRKPAEWTAAARACLPNPNRTALACDLGDMRKSKQRTLLLTARTGAGGPSEVPVVVQTGAANIPPATVSRDSSRPAALRLARSFRRTFPRSLLSAPGDVTPSTGPWPSPRHSAAPPSASPYPPASPPVNPYAYPPASPYAYPPVNPYANPSVDPSSSPSAGLSGGDTASAGPSAAVSPPAEPSSAGPSPVRSASTPGAGHGPARPHRARRPHGRHGLTGAPRAAAGPRPEAPARPAVPPAAPPAAPPAVPQAPVIPHLPVAPGRPEVPPPLPVVPGGTAAAPPPVTPAPPVLPEIAGKPSQARGVSEIDTLSPAGAMQAGRVSWATLIAVAIVTEAGMLWLIAGLTVWRRRPRQDGRDRPIRSLRPLISRLSPERTIHSNPSGH